MLVAPKNGALRPLLRLAHAHFLDHGAGFSGAEATKEITPMEGPQKSIVHSQEAMQLFRSFSFELESRNTEDLPQSELTLALVEERERDDEREKNLSELRKHFEPCPISEY